MGRKVKYNYDFKLRCVKQVLNHYQTIDTVSKLYVCHHTTLYDWIHFYEKHGKKVLLPNSLLNRLINPTMKLHEFLILN